MSLPRHEGPGPNPSGLCMCGCGHSVSLPPAPKVPCPLCGMRLSDLDLMAHLNWHRAGCLR